jgi:hypothetical protein
MSKIVPSFLFLGKCNTFLFKLIDKFGSNHEIKISNNENILSLTKPKLGLFEYLFIELYIHSSESMPSLSNYNWINSHLLGRKNLNLVNIISKNSSIPTILIAENMKIKCEPNV